MSTFPDLIAPLYAEVEKRITRFPCHTNRASSLGGPCERELTYDRASWEQAALPDVDLQIIFEEGSQHEKQVLRDLQEAGFEVVDQQSAIPWKEFQITGHVDALIAIDCNVAIPIDVKSMSPHIWDSVAFRGKGVYSWPEVAEAFQSKPWLKRYLGQITLYALLKNVDRGILLLKNKATGALAQVNVEVDFAYGEELLQRATRINGHVAAGTLPDRIPWDEETCPRCKYFGICLPERVGKDPLVFLEDAKVEALLEERAQVEEAGREFKKLDERAKEWAKARPESSISIGRFLIRKNGTSARTMVQIEKLTK